MTPTETQAFNQMRDALVDIAEASDDQGAVSCAIAALAAANAVQPQAQDSTDMLTVMWCLINAWRDAPPPALHICGKINSLVLEMIGKAAHPQASAPASWCWCETCRPITIGDMRMVVCPECGNKRCPKATHHDNTCTNSNEPGQKGSSWEGVKPAAPEATT